MLRGSVVFGVDSFAGVETEEGKRPNALRVAIPKFAEPEESEGGD